jgi:hypothetical protein
MENQPGVLGWARITVRQDIKHDLDHPLFEGAFSIYGDTHHVKLTNNYHLTKRSDDADLPANSNSHMIMYRDSNTITKELNPFTKSSGECGFDKLSHTKRAYNPLDIIDYTKPTMNQFGAINTRFEKRAPAGCPTSKKSKKNNQFLLYLY